MTTYTPRTLATHWGCKPGTVYRLIKSGQLRAFPIGARGLRISQDEVERWEAQSARAIETEAAPSGSGTEKPLPTSAMKLLASAGG